VQNGSRLPKSVEKRVDRVHRRSRGDGELDSTARSHSETSLPATGWNERANALAGQDREAPAEAFDSRTRAAGLVGRDQAARQAHEDLTVGRRREELGLVLEPSLAEEVAAVGARQETSAGEGIDEGLALGVAAANEEVERQVHALERHVQPAREEQVDDAER